MKSSAMIELRHPATVPAAQVLAFHTAFAGRGSPVHGSSLAGFATLAEWLAFVDAPAGTRHPQGYEKVADSTFVAWHKTQQRVCGIINIRHELNEFLRQYGGVLTATVDFQGRAVAHYRIARRLS